MSPAPRSAAQRTTSGGGTWSALVARIAAIVAKPRSAEQTIRDALAEIERERPAMEARLEEFPALRRQAMREGDEQRRDALEAEERRIRDALAALQEDEAQLHEQLTQHAAAKRQAEIDGIIARMREQYPMAAQHIRRADELLAQAAAELGAACAAAQAWSADIMALRDLGARDAALEAGLHHPPDRIGFFGRVSISEELRIPRVLNARNSSDRHWPPASFFGLSTFSSDTAGGDHA